MKRVIEYIRDYVGMCSACPACRNGSCLVLGLFRQSVQVSLFSGEETCEERVVCIHQEIDDSGCDQIAFADLIDNVERDLRQTPVPTSYPALSALLNEIKLLHTWIGRMSKNRRLLLSDVVGAVIEHILAYLDYSYLEAGLDLEILFSEAFPGYKRIPVLRACNYPEVSVIRYIQRARVFKEETAESGGDMIANAMLEWQDNVGSGPTNKSLQEIYDAFFDDDSPFHHGNAFLPNKTISIGTKVPRYPGCGEKEIDNLAVYHSTLPEINRYIEEVLIESFRGKCQARARSVKGRVRNNWFSRVIKALDYLYAFGTEHKNEFLRDIIFNLFDVLEQELNTAARIGYVWLLCERNGTTTLASDYYWEIGLGLEGENDNIDKLSVKKSQTIEAEKKEALQPYLLALVNRKYIRDDYSWIRTKEDKNGHKLYGAAWAAHIFRLTLKIPQEYTGNLFGIKFISTYLRDIDLKDESREEIEAVFRSANLNFKH